MKRYCHPLLVLSILLTTALPAQDISPEFLTGQYRNPIIHADYDWFRITP